MAKQTTATPWERQERESAKAFEAFSLYLHMGAERSIRAVAQRLNKSATLIQRWSGAWDWPERARAWDNDLALKAKKQAEKDVEEMQKRHIKAAQYFQSKAIRGLDKVPGNQITARDAATLFKAGVDIERLARGEVTERTEGNINGAVTVNNPYAELTTEELRRLAALAEDTENAED